MGLGALEETAQRLIAGGRDPSEPSAAIAAGTTGAQQVVVGQLGTIAKLVRDHDLSSPVTTVIGSVVELREKLAWFERRPLLGRRVAVTRPRDQAASLTNKLASLGAEVISLPLIDITEPDNWEHLDAAMRDLAQGVFDWVMFASTNAVRSVRARMDALELDARAFATCRIGVVGKATAEAVSRMSLRPDLVAEPSTARGLAEAIGRGEGRVLFPRAAEAPHEPVALLEHSGWTVQEVHAYANVPGTPEASAVARVLDGAVDVVAFTSPSTVDAFEKVVGPVSLLDDVDVISIGPTTTEAAAGWGIEVAATAEPHDSDGLVDAIVRVATGAR